MEAPRCSVCRRRANPRLITGIHTGNLVCALSYLNPRLSSPPTRRLVRTQVGAVYAFGFIMMCPQLYINYRLKSVAHMPWRQMTYKFLNTIIDDLFAFVIKMPLLHRLSVFRDDLIFVIYLYQRWVYRVDMKRVNEFGFGGDDAGRQADGVVVGGGGVGEKNVANAGETEAEEEDEDDDEELITKREKRDGEIQKGIERLMKESLGAARQRANAATGQQAGPAKSSGKGTKKGR
jgi:hypothetical protein